MTKHIKLPKDQAKKYPINFITGNRDKLKQFLDIIDESQLDSKFDEIIPKQMDLDELQGNPEFIATQKAKEATLNCDTAVIIEDVSLSFNALGGLPGPYITQFWDNIGGEGLCNIIKGFEDKTGYAQCTYAFYEGKGKEQVTFVGKLLGKIV